MQVINAPGRPDPALFWRAILFGVGGAILGASCYGLFIGLTHINIGYLAILVAHLIAKGITMGSGGQGGRAYQISAVVLTYLAVAAANAGVVMWETSRVATTLLSWRRLFSNPSISVVSV